MGPCCVALSVSINTRLLTMSALQLRAANRVRMGGLVSARMTHGSM